MVSTINSTESPYRFIDYVRFFIAYQTGATSSVLISAMVLGKLLLLKYPLKQRSLSKKHAHWLCAGIWVVCIFVPVLQLGIDKDDITFDYRTYYSTYRFTSSLSRIFAPVCALLFVVIPVVTVVVSTVLILKQAKKVVRGTQESLRWQGITTVVLTAAVYTIAFLPTTIYFFAEPFLEKDPDKPGSFHIEFFRVAIGILQFQVLSNFFIYSFTVASFRRFLVVKVYEIFFVCLKKSKGMYLL